jgi:anaerobic magnesium-protoporphyrin IX monomethyl ester cyclase
VILPRRRHPILLAHSYYLLHDPKQVRKMKPYPPLATLLGAAVLRREGYDVALFDAMLARGVEEFAEVLEREGPAVVVIVEDNFNFLTKMCTERMRADCLAMIRECVARGCRVLVCGSDAADHPHVYLGAGTHAVMLGEPEHTLAEVVRAWEDDPDADLAGVAGLVLAGTGAGRVRHTGARPAIEDLDALPLPAWDLVDIERYREEWTRVHGYLSWNVVTSRGCPYGCNWCAKPLFGRRYNQRAAASVADELRKLKDEVAPDGIWFADDIFGLTAKWIEDFAREVEARDARIPFTMQSRVNLMSPRVVDALARAGAAEVWLGVESGSQEILDAMDKGTRLDEIRAGTRALKAGGVHACWFIQLGYPGEGWDEVLLTRDLIRSERPDEIGVSVAYPLPGTEFHRRVRDQIGRKKNWIDSDDLAMLFQGTFTTGFYRRIRDLLHREIDLGEAARPELDAAWADLAATCSEHRSPEPLALAPRETP